MCEQRAQGVFFPPQLKPNNGIIVFQTRAHQAEAALVCFCSGEELSARDWTTLVWMQILLQGLTDMGKKPKRPYSACVCVQELNGCICGNSSSFTFIVEDCSQQTEGRSAFSKLCLELLPSSPDSSLSSQSQTALTRVPSMPLAP